MGNKTNFNFFFFQGKIETQGDYNDVLSSGIDIASILNKSEENLQMENAESDGTRKSTQNSSHSLKSIEKSVEEMNSKNNLFKDKENAPNEQNVLLKELEASSKGKVKGSLLLNYLNSAKRPFALMFIVVTFTLAQTFASLADVWVSYW